MSDELFLPQLENRYAAGSDQFNAADIVLGRLGGNFVPGATGSGTVGTQAWIDSVQANTNSYGFVGVISEVIVFDRKLNEQERQNVYGYLSRKYNLNDRLPDVFYGSHNSSFIAGTTYWVIEPHPNSKGVSSIPAGICFDGITISDFLALPSVIYKSAGTVLPNGTVLSGDTYSNIGT